MSISNIDLGQRSRSRSTSKPRPDIGSGGLDLREVALKHWHTSSALTGGAKTFLDMLQGGARTFLEMLQGGANTFFTDT